jgi:hypothetical protein
MSKPQSQEGNESLRNRPIPEIMPFLNEAYSRGIVAYAIQETLDLAQIDDFAFGDTSPSFEQETRLRDMVEVAEVLQTKGFTSDLIQSVMFGENSQFDGEAPISIIRKGESYRVASAAPGFVEGYH